MTRNPRQTPDPDRAELRPRRSRLPAIWSVPTYRFAILFLSMLVGIAFAAQYASAPKGPVGL